MLTASGSSPLARGTLCSRQVLSCCGRFIPAGAGNTFHTHAQANAHSVHPRWRGEHGFVRMQIFSMRGSSPLARGTRPVLMPAWSSSPVHPRWRGEHGKRALNKAEPDGSSPLARGTRKFECAASYSGRFIPAGAGNTPRRPGSATARPVHPRWRGEHGDIKMTMRYSHGSSPLARGTLRHRLLRRLHERFIPAGAGNTSAQSSRGVPAAVHPRWRGEHNSQSMVPLNRYGSSPLARGTHLA
ncbi:Domain of uncharacterised function (DUF2825) [Ectopseudomonas oleovorans]|uniref:Domain of uncharacterized function (DUF2825) n=1 Tax=Ectopseudomonas oleovorans TaxID=301 RepID=A0A379JQE2_ECTOL|nr:Domain of uncharacterised function (DUF2825) [Pseudomonas oleovorans]